MFRRATGLVVLGLAVLCVDLGFGKTSWAAFHLWDIVEVYSDASGTVQFIELFTTSNSQDEAADLSGRIASNSNSFAFPNDLPSNSTGNRSFLVGTTAYDDLATTDANIPSPDYVVPNNFFSTSGDTLRAIWQASMQTFDTLTFMASDLPTDGVNSLNHPFNNNSAIFTSEVNSPTNFTGDTGSIMPVNAGLAGDYNDDGTVNAADYVTWRNAIEGGGSLINEGDNPGTVDQGDYDFWVLNFGETGAGGSANTSSTIPEPTAMLSAIALLALTLPMSRRTRHG